MRYAQTSENTHFWQLVDHADYAVCCTPLSKTSLAIHTLETKQNPSLSTSLDSLQNAHINVGEACLLQSWNFPFEVNPVRCYSNVAHPVHCAKRSYDVREIFPDKWLSESKGQMKRNLSGSFRLRPSAKVRAALFGHNVLAVENASPGKNIGTFISSLSSQRDVAGSH